MALSPSREQVCACTAAHVSAAMNTSAFMNHFSCRAITSRLESTNHLERPGWLPVTPLGAAFGSRRPPKRLLPGLALGLERPRRCRILPGATRLLQDRAAEQPRERLACSAQASP